MKRFLSVLSFVLLLVFTLSLAAGCSSDAETGLNPAGSPSTSISAPEPPVEPAEDFTYGSESELSSAADAPVHADSSTTAEHYSEAPGQGQQTPPSIHPGLLTAGEWNDNENHSFLLNLIQTNENFRTFESMWQFDLTNQVKAIVTDGENPVNNSRVELLDAQGNVIYSARTNNKGVAYLFTNLRSTEQNAVAHIRASSATSVMKEFDPAVSSYDFSVSSQTAPKSLDLTFVIDTTGSMGDELEYLKMELEDIIRNVSYNNSNMDIRLSVNVYRDVGDDYVVRSTPFENDINNQIAFLRAQRAQGGGDWEEAVEQALADALEDHDWNDSATAKLMFLVLDAPPHNTESIRNEMHRLTALSSDMGVRIIPIASSGIDKVTEFLLRTLSAATGGTYVFLTDHSGIGEPHIDPTIEQYTVELLDELIVRVINEYLE